MRWRKARTATAATTSRHQGGSGSVGGSPGRSVGRAWFSSGPRIIAFLFRIGATPAGGRETATGSTGIAANGPRRKSGRRLPDFPATRTNRMGSQSIVYITYIYAEI